MGVLVVDVGCAGSISRTLRSRHPGAHTRARERACGDDQSSVPSHVAVGRSARGAASAEGSGRPTPSTVVTASIPARRRHRRIRLRRPAWCGISHRQPPRRGRSTVAGQVRGAECHDDVGVAPRRGHGPLHRRPLSPATGRGRAARVPRSFERRERTRVPERVSRGCGLSHVNARIAAMLPAVRQAASSATELQGTVGPAGSSAAVSGHERLERQHRGDGVHPGGHVTDGEDVGDHRQGDEDPESDGADGSAVGQRGGEGEAACGQRGGCPAAGRRPRSRGRCR